MPSGAESCALGQVPILLIEGSWWDAKRGRHVKNLNIFEKRGRPSDLKQICDGM